MPTYPFTQVNVFSTDPLGGNPLAVVHAAEGLIEAQMAALARWTNLSETTFLLPPTDTDADYYVRIFTPGSELPFAGHPTLGSCRAWSSPRRLCVVPADSSPSYWRKSARRWPCRHRISFSTSGWTTARAGA